MQSAIQKAIVLAKSQSKLAKIVGISPQALSKQIRRGQILPKYCIKIEEAFPGQISRYELNPDHFGKPEAECLVIVVQNLKTTSATI